ncbi:MAG: hypothetical protein GF307_14250 [candidate division Zixibacteria bacterium]|nr:hypothetical protein [candidate division Zixibacteria bacterium]
MENGKLQRRLANIYIILIALILLSIAATILINFDSILENPNYYTSAPDKPVKFDSLTQGFYPVALILLTPLLTMVGAIVIIFRRDRPTVYYIAAAIIYLIVNAIVALA